MNEPTKLDHERLRTARLKIGECIEDGRFESYQKGQLGVALRIVQKYENVLREKTEA